MNDTLLDPFLTPNDDLEKKLTLIKAIRAGQLPLNKHSWRGLLKNLDETSCRTLQEQSLAEGIPISTRLGSDNFDLDQMKAALASIIYNVYELELEPILNPIHLVEGLNNVLPEFLEHSLKDDAEYLSSLSETLGVSSAILKLIGEALIEPSLTRISSMCLKGFLEGWVDLTCPVCGRIPSVATKDESEPWRFKCCKS